MVTLPAGSVTSDHRQKNMLLTHRDDHWTSSDYRWNPYRIHDQMTLRCRQRRYLKTLQLDPYEYLPIRAFGHTP